MHGEFSTSGFSDALVVLGAAGIIIPAFTRFRISPVIGFILIGIFVGPFGLGALTHSYPGLNYVSISDAERIEPFAELGIVLLLFSAGLHISFRRLQAMRHTVFGVGSAELIGSAVLISGGLLAFGVAPQPAIALGLALSLSSTALVLPISGVEGPVGRSAFAMLLFEDLALVPMLFAIEVIGGHAEGREFIRTALLAIVLVAAMLAIGRLALPSLFAQAARAKNPELFLAISLLTVILASLATSAVGLSPILGALIAGILIGETDYHAEVETIVAPLAGLALGIFLITVGMRIDLRTVTQEWPTILGAAAAVLIAKAIVTTLLLRVSGSRRAVSVETGILMASPSETSLIVISAAAGAGLLAASEANFWTTVTAIGLTVTPLLAKLGRFAGKRAAAQHLADELDSTVEGAKLGQVFVLGFGRVGRIVAEMLEAHGKDYLAVDADIDGVAAARADGYDVLFGDVSRPEFLKRLAKREPSAFILTMDNPVLVGRLTRALRKAFPDLPIIARARDTSHASKLYRAGVTDAVPETLEASLQLSEAALVDLGVAMGPVIASIHEKRSELRARIMQEAELDEIPALGRRLRDVQTSPAGSNRSTPAV
ncbi:cation:proton antiporter [Sphingomonas hankyongi]|uniref:Cation:proton antiporter n=1 Tax=Sphingomonas hankyongi TaxID=2908209 RepID=A0ABT0S3R5_9SPHN|nr:cation:proton antiporter [Sphingomonas hankyongi]MCL6730515.1 cation:proton antiporter [Sphingomonas hankyongi]